MNPLSKQKGIATFRDFSAVAVGNVGVNVQVMLFNMFMVLYMTNVAKINPAVSAIIVLVVRITDAFTDIGFAFIGDRTKTRWGSYRPWLMISIIPTAVVSALFFCMPDAVIANETAKIIWATVFLFLATSLFMTVTWTSIGTIGVVSSPDPSDRRLMGILRQWGNQLGAVIIFALGTNIMLKFSAPGAVAPDKAGFAAGSWVFAIIMTVFFGYCALASKERVPVHTGKKVPLSLTLKAIGKNPLAWGLLIISGFINGALQLNSGMASYIWIYVLGNTDMMSVAMSVGMIVALLCTTIVMPIVSKRVPRNLLFLIMLCAQIVIWIVNGISLSNGNAVAYAIGFILYNATCGMMISTTYIMIPDASDYGEYITGTPVPGAINSVASFANKIALGLGTSISAVALSITGFEVDLGINQASETLSGLIKVLIGGNIIFFLLAFIGLIFVARVSKEKMAEVRAALAEKRAALVAEKN